MKNYIDFYKRWNMPFDNNEMIPILKNKLLNAVETHLSYLFGDGELVNQYMDLCGQRYTNCIFKNSFGFENTEVYKLLSLEKDFTKFMFYIENLFNLSFRDVSIFDDFYADLAKLINSSGLNIRITKNKTKVYFLPKGMKLIDKVIDENLLYLEKYPNALKHLEIALAEINNKDKWNSVLENIRQSLEQLLQSIFNNKKTLENNILILEDKLKDLNIEGHIRNKVSTHVRFLTNYFNNNSKHNLKEYIEEDIEFILYETTIIENYIIKTLGDSK